MSDPIIDVLADEWTALDELSAGLTEQQWKTPTALPGWTVQDCISHVIGIERMLMGDPQPDVATDHLAHVNDPMAISIESWVEERRTRSGREVLAEYREQTARRLEQLRAMTDDEMDELGWSPVGEVPYRVFMRVRVFDCWMHEQDMRRALDLPGHLEGPAVDITLERIENALGYVVGKKAGAPDGSSVVFELDGAPIKTFTVVVDGRAKVVDEVPDVPTCRIRVPFESFVALGGGRWDADEAVAAGGIEIEGDQQLARRILESMAFTP
jgi:uncharacterized protein (TIGR03083 family)